jgi:4-oxalomesaconate tautomerase
VAATGDETRVAIFMENTGQVAVATVQTPGGTVTYAGDAAIDGVPGTHAPVPLEFRDTAGSSCALLPSGNAVDDPGRGRDADRQRHALRGDEGARRGHHRL